MGPSPTFLGVVVACKRKLLGLRSKRAAWKSLPGLLIGRLVTGASVGLAAGTAITYLNRAA